MELLLGFLNLQYFIVSIIVAAVIVWQYVAFRSNEKRISRLHHLFPSRFNDCYAVTTNGVTTIFADTVNVEFTETLNDINSYLEKNKNKTFDYHIIKEIVDRKSQSLEDEVDTMLSTPLYLGLIATIFGIAFGVVFFAWEGLPGLLSSGNVDSSGIKVLLTDVGIAMFASLCGVLFTKISTSNFNEAKTEMSSCKNRFLTWVQTDLMSKLSDDITGAIIKMTNDLNEFNRTFSQNTRELKETLSTVNSNYEGQVKLLQAIENIKITKIAKANIAVYDRLEGCTDELEKLFTILSNSEEYVQKVIELNAQLGTIEERTRLFEELGQYFKNEIEYVKDRQGMMRQHMSSLDSVLQEALSNMGDSIRDNLQNLLGVFQSQNQSIQQLIEDQQRMLSENLTLRQVAVNESIAQMDNPFGGLQEIFEKGIEGITNSFSEQNKAIKEVLASQNLMLEEALQSQQHAIKQKLGEAPNQLEVLSKLAQSVDRLNKSIERLESRSVDVSSTQTLESTDEPNVSQVKGVKGFFLRCRSNFVSICAGGSFLILLAMLLIMLFGAK